MTAVAEGALATRLGTPRAASWDDDWLALVDETEARLGRRICGAHAPDGEPCELASTHRNGRCRFHGGHPRIGAQPGNSNAMVHGLYSRRLRQCDDMCAMWSVCPFSGMDVLRLPARKRPVCAFEAEAYATATGTSLVRLHTPLFSLGTSVNGGASARSGEPPQAGMPAPPGDTRGGSGIPAGARNSEIDRNTGISASASDVAIEPSDAEVAPAKRDALKYVLHCHSLFPGKRNPGPRTLPPDAPGDRGKDRDTASSGAANVASEMHPDTNALGGSMYADPASECAEAQESGAANSNAERAIAVDTGGILYAMLQRATLTLAAHSLTDHTEAQSSRYSLRTTKVSAGLDAFLRIARELRAWVRSGAGHTPKHTPFRRGTRQDGAREDSERPMFNERGERIHYDAKGRRLGLPDEMLPFLKELDAAVEELKRDGVDLTPQSGYFGDPI